MVVVSPAKDTLTTYLTQSTHPLPVVVAQQPAPTGIGDAVRRCWHGEPVGVLLPDDVVLESRHWADLISVHHDAGAAALCVRPVPHDSIGRFGIAECHGDRIARLIEKPPPGATQSNLAIFGRYIVTEAVIDGLNSSASAGELELTFGFDLAARTDPGVRAVTFTGMVYDCGTPSAYAASINWFSKNGAPHERVPGPNMN